MKGVLFILKIRLIFKTYSWNIDNVFIKIKVHNSPLQNWKKNGEKIVSKGDTCGSILTDLSKALDYFPREHLAKIDD